ncbi:MAG: hypothetical protein AAF738_10460, partial [Bacteroidota bacterium]
GTGGVGIHHPSGDVKMIATHSTTPQSVQSSRYWRIYWNVTPNGHSVTEGGSSGSGLFQSSGLLIGQLFGGFDGGQPNCDDPFSDEGDYGKLSYSWDNNGATDSRRRLRDWLDPVSGGTTTAVAGRAPGDCPPIGLCERADRINCGESKSGNTTNGSDTYDTHSSGSNWTGNEYTYLFIPNVTNTITITLTNNSTSDLGLFVLSSCDSNTELVSSNTGGAGENEQISYAATSGTGYYIMVDGRFGGAGAYEISIDCPIPPTSCDFQNVLYCGENKSDTNVDGRTDYFSYANATYSYTGPEKVYQIIAAEGTLTATLNFQDSSKDLDLLLLANCDPDAALIAQSTGTTTTETVTTTVPAGGAVYYLIVEGYSGGTSDYTLNLTCESVVIAPKILLQGAYNGLDMTTNLYTASLLPETEPYSSTGYTFVGGGSELAPSSVLAQGDLIDWVVVELRDANVPNTVLASKAALLKKDGSVVNHLDGISPISFPFPVDNPYHIAIRHRNHLGIMTGSAVRF